MTCISHVLAEKRAHFNIWWWTYSKLQSNSMHHVKIINDNPAEPSAMHQCLKYIHISVDNLLNTFTFISPLLNGSSSLILVSEYICQERGYTWFYIFSWKSYLKISRRQFNVVLLFKHLEMETSFLISAWRNDELFYVGNFYFHISIFYQTRHHWGGIIFSPGFHSYPPHLFFFFF